MNTVRGRKGSPLKIIIIVIAVIVAFGLIVFAIDKAINGEEGDGGDSGKWGKEGKKELKIGKQKYEYEDQVKAYLIIGTDDTSKKGEGGDMADFLVLAVTNKTQNAFGFIEIDRDTIVEVPVLEDGEEIGTFPEQICIAHWEGRNEDEHNSNTVKAVRKLLGGIDIHGYYTFRLRDIKAVNHAVGGVTVDIKEDLTKLDPEFKKGTTVLLDDKQAEKFVRARKEVGDGTNEERMTRQREYMKQLYSMVIGQLREEPEYLDELHEQLKDRIETDENMSETSRIANFLSNGESRGFLGIDGKTRIGDTIGDGKKYTEFHADKKSIAKTLGKLIELKEVK